MNEDPQKLLYDAVKAEKKAAEERERIIRSAAKEQDAILNRGVLSRSRSIAQQKASEIQGVREKQSADLKNLEDAETERKRKVAEQLESLDKAEPFKNQHDARTEAPGWLASLQEEQRIELEILDLEERLGREKQRSDPRWAPFDAATLKQLAKAGL